MSDVLKAKAAGSQKVNIKQVPELNEISWTITEPNVTLLATLPAFDLEQRAVLEGFVSAMEVVAQQAARTFRVQSTSPGVFAETAVAQGVLEVTALAEGEGTRQAGPLLLRVTLKAI